MSGKNMEERLTALEKEVAELKERVSVQPEKAVPINISATLTIAPGYNADSVMGEVAEKLRSYIHY